MIKPIVKYLLRKKSKESDRNSSLVHGNLIMNVAVVANYDDGDSFKHVLNYVRELRERGIKVVDFYVYFPTKKSLEAYTSKENAVHFTKSSFNPFGKIINSELAKSLRKDYEVLIDLSLGKTMACDVLVSKLNAKWKAGSHSEERTYLLDFMIDLKDEKDIQKLIHHIDQYIFNFNNTKAA